jgi:hypothetical protein
LAPLGAFQVEQGAANKPRPIQIQIKEATTVKLMNVSIPRAAANFFECGSISAMLSAGPFVPVVKATARRARPELRDLLLRSLGVSLQCALFLAGAVAFSNPAAAQTASTFFPLGPSTVSTVPSNGDVNPYGVAFVPRDFPPNGAIQTGDILVSNFNNSANLQGTGASITRITPRGATSTFFASQVPGLTAALGILRAGYVFVGNLPTTDGTSNTVQPGSIQVVDRNGKQIGALSGTNFVNGPWGIAIFDRGDGVASMFVSNVLDGSVVRFDLIYSDGLRVFTQVKIASEMNHRFDPAALVLGPSGLALDVPNDILYVANSADNTIYAIPSALRIEPGNSVTPTAVYTDKQHLHGPLDLAMLPNGNLIVANSDGSNADPNQPSELVEFTTGGAFVSQMSIDPNNGGAFGLALTNLGSGLLRFAAVDDNTNSLTMWVTSPSN